MKKIISMLLALVLMMGLSVTAFAADPTAAAYEAAKTYFETAEGKNMLSLDKVLAAAEAGDSLILDIRGAEDYAKGHIKGAVNIPFVEVVNYLDQLPRGQRIIVVCYSGQTAGQIVGSLQLGSFEAYTLSGGMGSVTETTPLETTVNEFVPAENSELTENEKALLEAIRVSMTIPAGKNVIQPAVLAENLDKYFVLDVRDKETFDKFHIEGAVNVPYYEVGGYIDQLPKDQTIAVVCNSGQQSSQTVAVLIAAGFDALNVQSGMNKGWTPANLPTVATVAPTAAAYEAAKVYFVNAEGKNMLSLDKVVAAAEAGEDLILDIRGAEDYAKGHIKGAVNIPFVEVVNYLDQLPRGQRIIVVCYSGQTAGQIVGSLQLAGFDAYTLSGGFGAVKEDTPLETTVNAFVPAENGKLTENEKALLEAARYAMTIPADKNVVQPAVLAENLDKYFVLDVRDKETFDKFHIEGAVNVPYYEMGGYIDQLPKDMPIAVVCNSGQQSSQTVAVLRAAGFQAYNVQSGMNNGWNKQNLPTVSTPVEPAPVEPAPVQPAGTYIVKPGDSLWKIAKNELGSGNRWNEIYNANTDVIRNPNLIYVGQTLKLPA